MLATQSRPEKTLGDVADDVQRHRFFVGSWSQYRAVRTPLAC